jgi:hypothetical protein
VDTDGSFGDGVVSSTFFLQCLVPNKSSLNVWRGFIIVGFPDRAASAGISETAGFMPEPSKQKAVVFFTPE